MSLNHTVQQILTRLASSQHLSMAVTIAMLTPTEAGDGTPALVNRVSH